MEAGERERFAAGIQSGRRDFGIQSSLAGAISGNGTVSIHEENGVGRADNGVALARLDDLCCPVPATTGEYGVCCRGTGGSSQLKG
jgi:hypothetical protein